MKYVIQNSLLKVEVSSHGAELQSIVSKDGTEYLWQGRPEYWKDRALNLFPYVARLTDGTYYMDGKQYQMRIHGIAPYSDFECVNREKDSVSFELSSSPDSFAQYPRCFSFRISYTLKDNRIQICFTVENKDSKNMFFGIGGHPGFNIPMNSEKNFEDYFICFEEACSPQKLEFSNRHYPTGETVDFHLDNGRSFGLYHELFDNDAVVLQNTCKAVSICCKDDPKSVTVEFPGMPYVGFWHMSKTDAPYVCIEPWATLPSRDGIIEDFSTQPGLICLAAGETYINNWAIIINQ